MRQKLPSLAGQVLLLTVLGSPAILSAEQWSRPLTERRSDDWIPIPKNPQVRQAEHGRDLKTSASTSIDQIGSLLTPPVPPQQVSQQSRVLRNPSPQLTGNGFFNQQFKAPPPSPSKSPNQNFFQFSTPQSFPPRPQPSQQTFKNEAVNNQFNSFLSQDPNGFSLTSVPNQFGPPQQVLFPQTHFPSPSFFQNQAFGDQSLPGRAPSVQQPPKPSEPTRTSKVRFPESNSGEDGKEEIQLLYVPVETLAQRGRTPNKLKPNDGSKFRDGPPPSQPNFFPQPQIPPQFSGFPPFPQFNQQEFPPVPQFIDDFSVKHRFNKPQEKPTEKPPVFQNQFIPQTFAQPKFPQEAPKDQQNVQQDSQKQPPKSTVDFAALTQQFALPEKAQSNFQFEFGPQNSQPNFPTAPQPGFFAEPPQSFPAQPQQGFVQSQSFPEPQQKFNQPSTTTPKSAETNFRQQEVSQSINEVTPTKSSFPETSPSQQPATNEAPANAQQLPGMTLAQFAANEQFFPQFPEQPAFAQPSFDPAPQPQIPQSQPQFESRPPTTTFFQPPQQDIFRPSPPLPQEDFQNQPFNSQPQFTSGRVPATLPPPHQPPLSVYMENVAKSKVGEVLNLLKNSKTIPVLDNVGKDTPQIFVGPSSLEPPAGYVKFELPYLSSLDTNRIERKVDKLPFFVAPLNFQPPSGYSKIPFPAPHIGSVVVSNATILRAALHEKPFEQQGIFEQSTPSQPLYTLPSEINSISPSQVNSLQTTPQFYTEEQQQVTETTTQRRTRYRTTTPPSSNYQSQRRPSSGTRQRKPLHRGFPKSQSTTTTTTEIPQEISTEAQYVPQPEVTQPKTHFGTQDQFIEQTIVPAGEQGNAEKQPPSEQNSQITLDQYFQQQQRQQPSQQFDVPNQPTAEGGQVYAEQSNGQQSPQDQQYFSQGSQQFGQDQPTYNQEQKPAEDQYTFQPQKSEGQNEATPAVEISSQNYQNILSPSQYHSEVSGKDQYIKAERVPEQAPVQQSVNGEPTYQQNDQINTVNEQQYVSQNQIDQNSYRPTETRYEQPQPDTTVASYVEINEPETEKPEKFTKTKNKFFEKTQERKEYTIPDQTSILQAHQRMNAFLAQEQADSSTSPQTTVTTEETTTKKLRGKVRARQRYQGRTSTTETPEEQNYPKNFRTQEQADRTSQNYPVYRPTEAAVTEETASSESTPSRVDKYNRFNRRRPLRPASTSTTTSSSEEVSTAATRTRVKATRAPPTASRALSGRTRSRRPGTLTTEAPSTTSTTETASTESLDWGTYVNSFAPSAGANEIASPYDDKSITFHNIESHRRNPSYNKVKNDGYWNNGVTIQQSEGVEVNPETFAPTESTAASRSYTRADTESSATTRGLDRKALYRQRLRQGAVQNDEVNVAAQQNQLRRANAHKERIAAKKLAEARDRDATSYDGNSLQSEGRQRGEEDGQQNRETSSQSEGRQRGDGFDNQQNFETNRDSDAEQQRNTESAAGKKAVVGRRRGAWVRVRVKKPQDVFETAESQSFAKLSGNALKNIEKPQPEAGKEQYVKQVSVDQVSLVADPAQTNPIPEEQKPEESSPQPETPEVTAQDSAPEDTPEVTPEDISPQVFQKDIGDMIRQIINGESEVDEAESHRDQESTEVTDDRQVSEMLVATTTPVAPKNVSVATTTTELEAETTRHPEEEVTTYATTIEPEAERSRPTEPITRRAVPTATTTEISLETEICYKGRCVKSKKTKATDLLPSE